MSEHTTSAPVVIVGAGAAGCTLALLLARRNIPTILVEQRSDPRLHPAAHVLNARSLEIWYEASPELVSKIQSKVPPIHDYSTIRWCTNIHAEPLGELSLLMYPDRVREQLEFSPFRVSHLGQHLLTPLLWEAVEKEKLIDFRKGWRANIVGQGIHLSKSGQPTAELTPRYIVAADGANSKLRDAAGIGMEGPVLANMGSVFFHAPGLCTPGATRPLLSWIYNPKFCGVMIAHDDDDYILMTAYLHRAQAIAQDSRAYWAQVLPEVIGKDTEHAIRTTGTWTMTSQIASRFRRDNLLLIGDAAHRFPHTGGFGLNSGVQDAHNLAWKLAAILHSGAPDSLLDTYETERKPVVSRFASQSMHNHFKLDEVTQELGISNYTLSQVTTIVNSPWLSWVPDRVAAAVTDFLTAAQISRASILADPRPHAAKIRQSIAARIPEQLEHFASPGLEFGYAYESPLIDASEGPCPPADVTRYAPTTHPGARLPHTAVFDQKSADTASLHRAIKPDGLTLYTPDPKRWEAGLAGSSITVPISVVALDASDAALRKAGLDLLEIDDAGAFIVRPDGHLVWRSRTGSDDAKVEVERLQSFLAPVWSTIYPSQGKVPAEKQEVEA